MSVALSVLIDTYNHEKYIHAAIASALTQEGLDGVEVDIVVVDDGSTDKTGEIVRSFGDVLRYHYKPNGGQASALNLGIPLCRGDIICFLDGDDWWHPRKLKTVLEAFHKNPTTCGVGHSIVEVDEVGGNVIKIGPPDPVSIDFASRDSIALFHRYACCLGTSRLAMKRWAALELLNVPQKLVFEADEYLFTLLPTLGEVTILSEALTYYRIHGANLYQDSRTSPMNYEIDPRLFKRASIYDCLSQQLPIELRKRGCDLSVIDLLLGPVQVQASRLKLATLGGTSLENFKSERRAAEVTERNSGVASKLVLWMSLGLALLLPPKWYFRLRHKYSNYLLRFDHKVLPRRDTSKC
jgi:Glycosyl transferase family 2